MKTILAKSVSYGRTRALTEIKAIVIHGTGNRGDTAEGNARYFATGNTRSAGAHFFVDQSGAVVRSIPMERVAWAVGGPRYSGGGGKYYGQYHNANTVSIELCDITDKKPSDAMVRSVKELIGTIRSSCPNAGAIIRHYDVNGKNCPCSMVKEDAWRDFLSRCSSIDKSAKTADASCPYKVRVTAKELNIRSGPGADTAVVGKIEKGGVYTIAAEKMNGSTAWGKLKSGAGWISLSYCKRA